MKRTPYTCCRCGYETDDKTAIRKHLYVLKKPCPGVENIIELTDEIKQHILDNRVYKIPKPIKQTKNVINNYINYNTMNNFISNMDFIEKLQHVMEYKNLELINFEDSVREKLCDRLEALKTTDEHIELRKGDLLKVIDTVCNRSNTSPKAIKAFNILYDTKVNKLKIYDDGEWTNELLINGVQLIMRVIQDSYLEAYEFFLIRRIKNEGTEGRSGQRCFEMLKEYYKFLGTLQVYPRVKNQSDSEILYNTDDDRYGRGGDHNQDLQEKYMTLYEKQIITVTQSESKALAKEILNIIKFNSQQNIADLNKAVLELFNMDNEFKQKVHSMLEVV